MLTAEKEKATDTLLLRIPEAAYLLGLGVATVHRLIRQDRLRVIRIDGSTRITRTEIEDFIRRGGQAAKTS